MTEYTISNSYIEKQAIGQNPTPDEISDKYGRIIGGENPQKDYMPNQSDEKDDFGNLILYNTGNPNKTDEEGELEKKADEEELLAESDGRTTTFSVNVSIPETHIEDHLNKLKKELVPNRTELVKKAKESRAWDINDISYA